MVRTNSLIAAVLLTACGAHKAAPSATGHMLSGDKRLDDPKYQKAYQLRGLRVQIPYEELPDGPLCSASLPKLRQSERLDPRVAKVVAGSSLKIGWFAHILMSGQYVASIRSDTGEALIRAGVNGYQERSCTLYEDVELPDASELLHPPTLFETTLPEFGS
jgi:hypothetical protein